MDDALHLAPVVRLDRDNLAAVALGEDALLGDAATDRIGEGGLDALFEPVLGHAEFAAGRSELVAGVVGDLAAGGDGFVDRVGETAEVADGIGDERDAWRPVADAVRGAMGAQGGRQRLGGGGQVARFQHLTDRGRMDHGPDVACPGKGDIDTHLVEECHFRGLVLEFSRLREGRRGTDGQGEFATDAEGGLCREQRKHLFELQYAKGVVVHACSSVERP